MQITATNKDPNRSLHDELILVVKRTDLFPNEAFQGLHDVDFQKIMYTVQEKKQFLPRSTMETDPTYKQIIPYLVYTHKNNYFLMQRHAKASETRLHSKFSFGIGGHIRQEDMQTDSIFDWARREFHEEVDYEGNLEFNTLGLLNDDSNEVGKVHIGLVLLLIGDTNEIRIKSELQSGTLISLNDAAVHYENMESWSQIVFDFLTTKKGA